VIYEKYKSSIFLNLEESGIVYK